MTMVDEPPAVATDDEERTTCESCSADTTDNEGVCDDCSYCAHCDTLTPWDDLLSAPNACDYVCRDCWHESYFTCGACGWEGSHDYRYYDERNGRDVCDECYEEPGVPAESLRHCTTCNTYAEHLNPVTEQYECDHERQARTTRFLTRLEQHMATAKLDTGRLPLWAAA